KILAAVPRRRQTLMFSATMPGPIRKLAADILRDPVRIDVSPETSAAVTVEHWVHFVAASDKPTLLARWLQDTPHSRALIFTRTKHGADRLTKHLARHGIHAGAIHGNKSQGARTRVLEDFRTARTPILVATDLAARGLDVDDVSHVINYDLTADPETYVHRIGRTGRAGAAGTAVSFCTTDERDNLRGIERLLQAPLQRAEAISISGMPTPVDASASRESQRPRGTGRIDAQETRRRQQPSRDWRPRRGAPRARRSRFG
ncbi:MAG: DEAD/DEAH box helicase, partial [Phycisphaerales bacterium]